MNLQGKLVILRALEPSDAPILQSLATASIAHRFTTPFWRPWSSRDFAELTEPAIERVTGGRFRLAICTLEESRLVGLLDLFRINWIHGFAELGIIIWPEDIRGRGYGTDAITTGARWAFGGLRLRRLFAKSFASNKAMHRCFEKVGFTLEGTWRQHYLLDGAPVDACLFGLLSSELREHQ